MRVGSLRKALKSRFEFVFLNAPFDASSTLTEERLQQLGGGNGGLTWFQWQDLGQDDRPSLALEYKNFDTTYKAVCTALQQHQPEGLFGFSQGATATALCLAQLVADQRAGRQLDVPVPKYAIMVRPMPFD